MITSADASVKPVSLEAKIRVEGLDVHYGPFHALKGVTFDIPARRITSMIGPSGCGKSTLLRCLNRMNDRIRGFRGEGKILLDGRDIYERGTDLSRLRKRVGMVFQRPNPFPLSVFENVAYGPKVHGVRQRPGGRGRRALAPGHRALGRGEGPARPERAGPFRASSSSGSASRGCWRWGPRCCSWTSPAPRSTPSRRPASRS